MRTLAGLLMLLATGAACADPGAAQRNAEQDAAVAFWTSGYAGAELPSANVRCPAPTVPAVSHEAAQIRGVWKAITSWESCHADYMASLKATPAEARIPASVLASMTPAERAQARGHVQAVQSRMTEAAQANAGAMMARHESWLRATVEYVAENKRSDTRSMFSLAREDMRSRQSEVSRQRMEEARPKNF